jgi:hypothetical protein
MAEARRGQSGPDLKELAEGGEDRYGEGVNGMGLQTLFTQGFYILHLYNGDGAGLLTKRACFCILLRVFS